MVINMPQILNQLRYNVNIYRRYKFWDKQKCIFIHVPKAAGTSINSTLYGRTLGHYSALEIKSRFPNLFQRSFTFSFVRNPWSRCLSAYNFARAGKTNTMAIKNPDFYQREEFRSFKHFVMEWLPNQNLKKIDFVFRPQAIFICDENDNVMLDFVGHLESLERDIKYVEKALGRSLPVKKLNSVGASKSYMEAYDDEMAQVVGSLYAMDIAKFNYSFC